MSRQTTILLIFVAVGAASLGLYLSPSETKKEPKPSSEKPFAKAAQGKGLFEEKCRTVAGEKIYRRVENVEGILLLKVRPQAGEKEWADPMWPGAAFARESWGDEYIETFLGYEHSSSPNGKPVSPSYRGYIGTDYQPNNPSNLPGYQFAEVLDGRDGQRYRYKMTEKEVTSVNSPSVGGDGKSYTRIARVLDKAPSNSLVPRYAVTFEDHVIPDERAFGIASSTVRVFDTQTQEVLGELIRFAWSPNGPSLANPSPWLRAVRCPDHAVGTNAGTRKFVDQVLLPKERK